MVPVEETPASSAAPSGVLVVPKTGNAVDPASFAAKAGKYNSFNDEL
jgi:hypothetical protein